MVGLVLPREPRSFEPLRDEGGGLPEEEYLQKIAFVLCDSRLDFGGEVGGAFVTNSDSALVGAEG